MNDWTEVSAWRVVGLFVRVSFVCAMLMAVSLAMAYVFVSLYIG